MKSALVLPSRTLRTLITRIDFGSCGSLSTISPAPELNESPSSDYTSWKIVALAHACGEHATG
jgi:hypothetical protein